jgi:hypothetical protein
MSWKHMTGLAMLMVTAMLRAQLISVRTEISSDSLMIGDQVLLTLHVEASDRVNFSMPFPGDSLGRDLEVLFPVSADTSRSGGTIAVDHSYLVTSFESGTHLVPSVPVLYTYNDEIDTARSMPLLIRVYEPEVDTSQQIKAIKPPLNTPVTLAEALPWIGLGAGIWMVGTLAGALVWMYRQKKRDPEIFSLKPQEPAHVVAFRELDRLKGEKLWESGRVKQYYTRLTEITRQYIERLYGIPAMESTTDEILQAFHGSNTDDALLDEMLKGLLELADLVKFAREEPLPVDNQTNLNNAYIFVQKTYPLFYMEKPAEQQEEDSGKEQATVLNDADGGIVHG